MKECVGWTVYFTTCACGADKHFLPEINGNLRHCDRKNWLSELGTHHHRISLMFVSHDQLCVLDLSAVCMHCMWSGGRQTPGVCVVCVH